MSEKPLPFVITDRRKFNAEGESRPTLEGPLAIARIRGLLQEVPLARRDACLAEQIPVRAEQRFQHIANEILRLIFG